MSHCAPEATVKPIRLKFTPETVVTSSSHKCAGRLLQTRVPAAAKLLSPNVLCVRGTAHGLSVDERSRPSKTKSISSAKYGGALPDNDEKAKHASLASVIVRTTDKMTKSCIGFLATTCDKQCFIYFLISLRTYTRA